MREARRQHITARYFRRQQKDFGMIFQSATIIDYAASQIISLHTYLNANSRNRSATFTHEYALLKTARLR